MRRVGILLIAVGCVGNVTTHLGDVPDAGAPAPIDGAPASADATVPDARHCTAADHPDPNASVGAVEEPGTGGCPGGMVRVAEFCVDKYEGSLWRADDPSVSLSPYFNPGSEDVVARSLAGVVPEGYINGTQAASACARAGKRLCSNTEWLRACRGPENTIYPYGDTR